MNNNKNIHEGAAAFSGKLNHENSRYYVFNDYYNMESDETLHNFLIFGVICLIIQGILCFVPSVTLETRWAMLLYCVLPPSCMTVGLGITKEESTIAANVCSILTVICLITFCIIAVVIA